MKKDNKHKFIFILILVLVVFFANSTLYAMTNESYSQEKITYNQSGSPANSMLTIFAEIVMPIIFPIFTALANLTKTFIYIFTGSYQFPWADRIIFNKIEFLDVNFINPSPNSLFLSKSGNITTIGTAVRSTYFTILAICLGILGIAVAFNAIKLTLSTIAKEKAKYKELINQTFITIVLIFGLHYLISFVFYVNEQLTVLASNLSSQILNSDSLYEAQEKINAAEDKDNEKLLNNFWDKCNHTSWWSPITILKETIKNLANLAQDLWDGLCKWVGSWFNGGDDEPTDVTLEEDDENRESYYEDIFPKKDKFIEYFKNENDVGKHGVDIAAYLLKNYTYRDYVLSMVGGNDTNRFSNSGVWGWLTSASNTVLWFTGIIDTGLQGLQNLFNSVYYIYNNSEMKLSSAEQYQQKINYYTKLRNNTEDKDTAASYEIRVLYYEAAYRYVYEGEDKKDFAKKSSLVEDLGVYFQRNSYYTDVDAGSWSPSTFNVIPSILYCVFVLQSFMFLFSYIKRLIYVVVLAIIAPITVIYDYIAKMY